MSANAKLKRILIVKGKAVDATVLAASLRGLGYEVAIEGSEEGPVDSASNSNGIGLVLPDSDASRKIEGGELAGAQGRALPWQDIIDAISDSVSIVSRSFEVIDINMAGARAIGMERAEIIGRTCHGLIHQRGSVPVECPCREAFASGHSEIREYERGGRYYSLEAWPINGREGIVEACVHVVKDITTRRLAEKAQREGEEHFKRLFSSVTDYVYSVEVEGGRVVRTTHGLGCEAVTGYGVEDYRRDDFLWYRMVHPDDREFVTKQALDAIQGRGGSSLEHRIIHRDGSLRWVRNTSVPRCDENGKVLSYDCVIIDITERKRAAETLRTANLRLEALWDIATLANADDKAIFDLTLSDIVRMTESEFGFLGFLDQGEATMTIQAWSGEAMRDCALADKPLEYRIAEVGVWGEAVRNRAPLIINDYSAPHGAKKGYPAGHVPLLRIMVVPVFSKDKIVSIAAVANRKSDYDETDLKQVTAFLNGVQAVLDRRSVEEKIRKLLAEKELILQEVHHRIKNNMSAIGSLLSIQADLQIDAKAVAALKDAQRRLISMGILYDKLYRSQNILELSASDYIPSLAKEVIREFPIAPSVRLITRMDCFALDARILSILGILINELIVNAMKYAFVGRESGSMTIAASLKNGRVSMRFEDDGVGLPESVDPGSSKGFGLRLVGELVRQLEGSLRVERGGGTRFCLEFPA